ncbi:hypothetical protein [Microbacterium sp. SORGH_AS_0888]|uniref:hypothetical protein n=1 Tax=Microbacterium sp. SORGH_AS_0888 TaxID=3041791 RepID=UPI0027D82295|nr:hypothetical protein [Microbacterium sp. SORGH_AS_0888]
MNSAVFMIWSGSPGSRTSAGHTMSSTRPRSGWTIARGASVSAEITATATAATTTRAGEIRM